MSGWRGWVQHRLGFLRKEGDTVDDVWTKQVLFLFLLLCSVFGVLLAVSMRGEPLQHHSAATSTVAVLLFVYLSVKREVNAVFLAFFVAEMIVTVFSIDITNATLSSTRAWVFMIVVLDVLLVSKAPRWVSTLAAGTAVVGIVLVEVELVARFGVMDMPGLPSYEQRTEKFCADPSRAACEEPPCAKGASYLVSSVYGVLIFVVDFVSTRAFAESVEVEKLRIRRSISVAHHVAVQLAEFNLEAANAALSCNSEDVPQGLLDAFEQLVANLESYRPYLPHSCFPSGNLTEDDEDGTQKSSVHSRSPKRARASSAGVFGHPAKFELSSTGLSQRMMSMLTCNVIDSTPALLRSTAEYAESFSGYLSACIATVTNCGGLVDLFVADRIYSTFNVANRCPAYSKAAVRAAFALRTLFPEEMNYGVGAGSALYGVLGCASMKRFSTISSVIRSCQGFERIGRMLNKSIVADARVEADTSVFCHFRLVPVRVMYRAHLLADQPALMLMWEATELIDEDDAAIVEWMYALQSCKNPAAGYNGVALAYVQGYCKAEADEPHAGGEDNNKDSDTVELIARIRDNVPPREIEISP
ncbi:hypothetical protein DIPPA_14799 [Diplonema papillatum]|nr:hypothetical protein DIPPA_14799 [Diplonema papillatum]